MPLLLARWDILGNSSLFHVKSQIPRLCANAAAVSRTAKQHFQVVSLSNHYEPGCSFGKNSTLP